MIAADIVIPAGDDALRLRAFGGSAVESLTALGLLLGSPALPAEGVADVELWSSSAEAGEAQIVLREMRAYRIGLRHRVFCLCRHGDFTYSGLNLRIEWRLLIALAAARAALDGRQVALLHGVWLGEPHDGTLLFGPSGIGKSTTMNRYRAAGGNDLADDLVLVGRRGGEFLARGLPTWKGFRYDPARWAQELRPVARLLCLTRAAAGEAERVEGVERDIFLAQLYAALLLHVKYVFAYLPAAEARRGGGSAWLLAEELTDRFAPRALFARLDADLMTTLQMEN